jgi:hypothetical protein
MKKAELILLSCSVLWVLPVLAECPSMDGTGDCQVDLADFAVFAGQWMTEGVSIPPSTKAFFAPTITTYAFHQTTEYRVMYTKNNICYAAAQSSGTGRGGYTNQRTMGYGYCMGTSLNPEKHRGEHP